MSQTRNGGADLYGLQIAQAEYTNPEPGTLKIRKDRNGRRKAQFVSNEDLSCYGVSRGVVSKWDSLALLDGYALIDKRRRVVFLFKTAEDGPPAPNQQVYVGERRIKIPARLRDKVPKVQGAPIAIHLHPTSRRPFTVTTVWAAGSIAELAFDRPKLTARVVADAPFRPYFLQFIKDYLGFVHKEARHLNSDDKEQHVRALDAIGQSPDLREVHKWACMEAASLRNGHDDGAFGGAVPRPGPPSVPTSQNSAATTPIDADSDVDNRPPIDIPRTRLELGDGDSKDACSDN